MSAILNPYLNFRGEAKQALEFYRDIFGGNLTTMTFAQMDGAAMQVDPADADKIMHGQLETPAGFTLMAADVPQTMQPSPNGTISVSGDRESAQELRGYWTKLAERAQVLAPLGPSPWGDEFGMLTDVFDVPWIIDISGVHDQS